MIYKVIMKGLIFIFLTYFVVIVVCALVKYLVIIFKRNKKGDSKIAQKIYYIQNQTQKAKKCRKSSPNIALKGTIVEKEDSKTPPFNV